MYCIYSFSYKHRETALFLQFNSTRSKYKFPKRPSLHVSLTNNMLPVYNRIQVDNFLFETVHLLNQNSLYHKFNFSGSLCPPFVVMKCRTRPLYLRSEFFFFIFFFCHNLHFISSKFAMNLHTKNTRQNM